jgi:hypothetical protein
MVEIIQILMVWPAALAVELSVVAFFLWACRDKPQTPTRSN